MIMEPTSRDKIERVWSSKSRRNDILAIGRSTIVATQIGLRTGSAYQDTCSEAHRSESAEKKKRIFNLLVGRRLEISRPAQIFGLRAE
jgi:hypothetical protein